MSFKPEAPRDEKVAGGVNHNLDRNIELTLECDTFNAADRVTLDENSGDSRAEDQSAAGVFRLIHELAGFRRAVDKTASEF